jgi:hypothetical protein
MIRSVPTAQNTSVLNAAFIAGWQQSLVEGAKHVAVGGKTYPVCQTAERNLALVDFELGGIPYRALEQNPQTKSG